MELGPSVSHCELEQEEMIYLDGGGQVVLYMSGAFVRDMVGATITAVGAVVGAYLAGPLGKWLGVEVGKFVAGVITASIFRIVGNSYARSKINDSWYKVVDIWIPLYTGTHWIP